MFFSIDIILLLASLHYCLVVEEVLGDCYRNLSSNDFEETDYINLTSNWNPVIDSCHLI